MNANLLLEQVNRLGIVNTSDLEKQTGAARHLIRKSISDLLKSSDLFFCRFEHGNPTLLSRDMYRCLRTVYIPLPLTSNAQDLLDWLSDNESSTVHAMHKASDLPAPDFKEALEELQAMLYITPNNPNPNLPITDFSKHGYLENEEEYLWVTSDFWVDDLPISARHRDLAYCMSEIRYFLRHYFTTREIERILYSTEI